MKQISFYSLCALALVAGAPATLVAQTATTTPAATAASFKPTSPRLFNSVKASMGKMVSEKKTEQQILARLAELCKRYPNNLADIVAATLAATNPSQEFAGKIVQTALKGAGPQQKQAALAAATQTIPAYAQVFTAAGINHNSPINQPLGDGTPGNTILNNNPSGGSGTTPSTPPIVPPEEVKPPVSVS